jgi:hypothetical protein
MKIGRVVYRSGVGQPLLVAAMLFQIGTGLHLAWRWSAAPQGFHQTYQVATGAYLSLFILGHMNSVFIYARSFLGIPTDWNFAIGAPTGLIHDAWNIRLLPHYALGVFFVLSHIASGLRVVLIAHGMDQGRADRVLGRVRRNKRHCRDRDHRRNVRRQDRGVRFVMCGAGLIELSSTATAINKKLTRPARATSSAGARARPPARWAPFRLSSRQLLTAFRAA